MSRVEFVQQEGIKDDTTQQSQVFSEEQKLESLLESSRQVKDTIKDNESIINEQEKYIAKLNGSITDLKKIYDNVEGDIIDAKQILSNLDGEIKLREETVNGLKKDTSIAITELSNIGKEIDSIRLEKIKELEEKIKINEVILSKETDIHTQLKLENDNLIGINKSLVTENQHLIYTNETITDSVKTKTQELFLVESKLEEFKNISLDVIEKTQQRDALIKEVSDLEIKKNIYVSEMETKRLEIEAKVKESENVIRIAESKADYLNRLTDKATAEKIISNQK